MSQVQSQLYVSMKERLSEYDDSMAVSTASRALTRQYQVLAASEGVVQFVAVTHPGCCRLALSKPGTVSSCRKYSTAWPSGAVTGFHCRVWA